MGFLEFVGFSHALSHGSHLRIGKEKDYIFLAPFQLIKNLNDLSVIQYTKQHGGYRFKQDFVLDLMQFRAIQEGIVKYK